ncbi:MAG: SMC-Scp complex subunit ScpB [Planctomycetales bacterium]|nr:SMC-Scp complex subunit ScpB [Planctomycetales bacterium]
MNATTVSPAAMRIIHVLAGNPPHTIQQLVEATGVTRTAVSEQVKDLMARGLVSRSTRRTQRGRPHHLYTATDHALSTLFSNHQRLMVPALLRAVADVAGQEVAREAMVRASKVLVQHYREQLTAEAPAERLRQFADVLSEEGILAEVSEEGGQLRLRQRNCPFADMVDDERNICSAERSMLDAIVGQPLSIVGCRLDGCPSCTFELAMDEPRGASNGETV